jgi:uncharacterized protein
MALSLLALLDDISTILDDVAVLTKVAAKKTAGVLGDDLALNAQQVAGVRADRELPVVWAVCKGSFLNKAILVPTALAISALAPWAITPLLMAGGAFLCFEGFEKLAHKLFHSRTDEPAHGADHHAKVVQALADPAIDLVALEKEKIKGAVRTDFILSAEIIVITLGTVQASPFMTQVTVLVGIALLMTVGVYGLVAGIVKLDDLGQLMSQRGGDSGLRRLERRVGRGILAAAPYLMKTLSIAGTAAMFLVGGSIFAHGIPWLQGKIEHLSAAAGPGLQVVLSSLLDGVVGIVLGAVVLGVVMLFKRVTKPATNSAR